MENPNYQQQNKNDQYDTDDVDEYNQFRNIPQKYPEQSQQQQRRTPTPQNNNNQQQQRPSQFQRNSQQFVQNNNPRPFTSPTLKNNYSSTSQKPPQQQQKQQQQQQPQIQQPYQQQQPQQQQQLRQSPSKIQASSTGGNSQISPNRNQLTKNPSSSLSPQQQQSPRKSFNELQQYSPSRMNTPAVNTQQQPRLSNISQRNNASPPSQQEYRQQSNQVRISPQRNESQQPNQPRPRNPSPVSTTPIPTIENEGKIRPKTSKSVRKSINNNNNNRPTTSSATPNNNNNQQLRKEYSTQPQQQTQSRVPQSKLNKEKPITRVENPNERQKIQPTQQAYYEEPYYVDELEQQQQQPIFELTEIRGATNNNNSGQFGMPVTQVQQQSYPPSENQITYYEKQIVSEQKFAEKPSDDEVYDPLKEVRKELVEIVTLMKEELETKPNKEDLIALENVIQEQLELIASKVGIDKQELSKSSQQVRNVFIFVVCLECYSSMLIISKKALSRSNLKDDSRIIPKASTYQRKSTKLTPLDTKLSKMNLNSCLSCNKGYGEPLINKKSYRLPKEKSMTGSNSLGRYGVELNVDNQGRMPQQKTVGSSTSAQGSINNNKLAKKEVSEGKSVVIQVTSPCSFNFYPTESDVKQHDY